MTSKAKSDCAGSLETCISRPLQASHRRCWGPICSPSKPSTPPRARGLLFPDGMARVASRGLSDSPIDTLSLHLDVHAPCLNIENTVTLSTLPCLYPLLYTQKPHLGHSSGPARPARSHCTHWHDSWHDLNHGPCPRQRHAEPARSVLPAALST